MTHAQAVIGQRLGGERRGCLGELQVVKTYETDEAKVPRPKERRKEILKCEKCGAEMSLSYGWQDDAHELEWVLYPSRPAAINNDDPGAVVG